VIRVTNILFQIILIFVSIQNSYTQVRSLNLNDGLEQRYFKHIYKPGAGFHPTIKPYDLEEISGYYNIGKDTLFQIKEGAGRISQQLFNKELISIGPKRTLNQPFNIGVTFKEKYIPKFAVSPLLTIAGGVEQDEGTRILMDAGAGVLVTGDFRKNMSVEGAISLNQAVFPRYLYPGILFSKAIPGSGYAIKAGDSSYRYLDINMMAGWKMSKTFKLEAGIGKHFFGDGYRSLLLSWNAPSYPYMKLTSNIWKLRYTNLYSLYNDSREAGSAKWSNYKYKFSSTHFLSFNIGKRFNAGFFETVVWDANFKKGDHRRIFDVHYLNPVIFFRPVEFSLGSPDNVLMGLTARMTVGEKGVFYGQLVLDEFVLGNVRNDLIAFVKRLAGQTDNLGEYGAWTNKQAYQFGYRHFDLFGIDGLNILAEMNAARPYIYSHRRPIKNYSHNGQALAHPLGANFLEGVLSLKYNYKRWFFSAHGIAAKTGLDGTNQHMGQDIFKPTYDTYESEYQNIPVTQLYNVIGQGISTRIINGTINTSYLINPVNCLRIEAGLTLRNISSDIKTDNAMIVTMGIKSGIDRFYRDF